MLYTSKRAYSLCPEGRRRLQLAVVQPADFMLIMSYPSAGQRDSREGLGSFVRCHGREQVDFLESSACLVASSAAEARNVMKTVGHDRKLMTSIRLK
jgi:hypothetical protein